MIKTSSKTSESITYFLNGTIQSIKTVIPVLHKLEKPTLLPIVSVEFGVLIGFTGDVKGRLLIKGEKNVFSKIGQQMFGMALEGEMLNSFTGELGNMLAGNLATYISTIGIICDITAPTVLEGSTRLAGFKNAIAVNVAFEQIGDLHLILLIDN